MRGWHRKRRACIQFESWAGGDIGTISRRSHRNLFVFETVLDRNKDMAGLHLESRQPQLICAAVLIPIDYLLRENVSFIEEVALYGVCQVVILIFDLFRLRRANELRKPQQQ